MSDMKTTTKKNTSNFIVLVRFNRYAFGQALLEHLNTWHAIKDSKACLMDACTADGFGIPPVLNKSDFLIVYDKKYIPMYKRVKTEIQDDIISFRKGWNAASKHITAIH